MAERDGFQDVSTLKEPYRLEGKKTMGYEIVEQLGWRMPDVILYPTGGGVGIIGIYKALLEMRRTRLDHRGPAALVAVQATGCAPIVEAFERGARESEPFPDARTVGVRHHRAEGAGRLPRAGRRVRATGAPRSP